MNFNPRYLIRWLALLLGTFCHAQPLLAAADANTNAELVARGQRLFFQETFNGNGRTCGTCHPLENNFTLDAAFIARLPDRHPLFVAEFMPELRENFESPRLMRQFGLIRENLDGFDDLENRFVMRAVPHTLGMSQSVASASGPRTGWSGDGAPGDGSLRAFSTGAVIQHFTRSLRRVPGVDFRLPSDAELDALEAYMLSLGRQRELALPLPLKGTAAQRGQQIFMDDQLGKCNLCHQNAGANARLPGTALGNANFDTGVENLPNILAHPSGELMPHDDGFGSPGNGQFNTPSLVEAADTAPFFHNNAVLTLEDSVAFYASDTFNQSAAGRTLAGLDPNGVGIKLDDGQVRDVAAFLRVINALENIRQSDTLLQANVGKPIYELPQTQGNLALAAKETDDAMRVLGQAGLHSEAVGHLGLSRLYANLGRLLFFLADPFSRLARSELDSARGRLVSDTAATTTNGSTK
jgi:mono/diheme cytochrome c family protein